MNCQTLRNSEIIENNFQFIFPGWFLAYFERKLLTPCYFLFIHRYVFGRRILLKGRRNENKFYIANHREFRVTYPKIYSRRNLLRTEIFFQIQIGPVQLTFSQRGVRTMLCVVRKWENMENGLCVLPKLMAFLWRCTGTHKYIRQFAWFEHLACNWFVDYFFKRFSPTVNAYRYFIAADYWTAILFTIPPGSLFSISD